MGILKNVRRKMARIVAMILCISMIFPPSIVMASVDNIGWKQNDQQKWTYTDGTGKTLASAWVRDNGKWYFLGDDGVMLEGPLVLDLKAGAYYLLNNNHDGTFGSMIETDGTYYGIPVTFNQLHDSTYGRITNPDAIAQLSKIYGVQSATGKEIIYVSSGTESSGRSHYSRKVNDDDGMLALYTISYDFDGGTDYAQNPLKYTKGGEDIKLVSPEKTGYTFIGWTDDDKVQSKPEMSITIKRGSVGDRSFTAHWKPAELTLSFASNKSDVEFVIVSGQDKLKENAIAGSASAEDELDDDVTVSSASPSNVSIEEGLKEETIISSSSAHEEKDELQGDAVISSSSAQEEKDELQGDAVISRSPAQEEKDELQGDAAISSSSAQEEKDELQGDAVISSSSVQDEMEEDAIIGDSSIEDDAVINISPEGEEPNTSGITWDGKKLSGVPYGTLVSFAENILEVGDVKIQASPSEASALTFFNWTVPPIVTKDENVWANFSSGSDLINVTYHDGEAVWSEEAVKDTYLQGPGKREAGDTYVRAWSPDETYISAWEFKKEKATEDMNLYAIRDFDYEEALNSMENVVAVKKISADDCEDRLIDYQVVFEQPLDWGGETDETFRQTCMMSFFKREAVNVLVTEGYSVGSEMNEIVEHYKGNKIAVEHRFFGQSVPEGLTAECSRYWKYMTPENAAADLHFIVQQLKTVVGGKWISTGASKGGFNTNVYAALYDDMDIYVPKVAPACNGISDPRFLEFVYNEIGDDGFGKTRAAEIRSRMNDIQAWCLSHRDIMATSVWNYYTQMGYRFAENATPDIFFDMFLLDVAANFWQTWSDLNVDMIDDTWNLINDTKKTDDQKKEGVLNDFLYMVMGTMPSGPYNIMSFPYYVQSYMNMGNVSWDASYLRKVLKDSGLPGYVAIPEDAGDEFFYDTFIPKALRDTLEYDGHIRQTLIEWSDNTDQHVIMIYGANDPWRSVRLPDTTNPNVHIYVSPKEAHALASINKIKEHTGVDLFEMMDEWLK